MRLRSAERPTVRPPGPSAIGPCPNRIVPGLSRLARCALRSASMARRARSYHHCSGAKRPVTIRFPTYIRTRNGSGSVLAADMSARSPWVTASA